MVRGTAVSLPVLGDSRVAQWRPMPELPQYRFLNPDEDEETSLSLDSDSTRRDDAGVTRTGDEVRRTSVVFRLFFFLIVIVALPR